MEKQDVKKILLILQAEYPERYKKTDKPTMQMTAEMWYQTTLPYPYEIVINAVTAYIAGPDCRYAPKPGQIIEIIEANMKASGQIEDVSKYEAWDSVMAACGRGGREADFNSLPKIAQNTVGSARRLQQLSTMSYNSLEFEKNRFFERFEYQEDKQERTDRYNALTGNVIASIGEVKRIGEVKE